MLSVVILLLTLTPLSLSCGADGHFHHPHDTDYTHTTHLNLAARHIHNHQHSSRQPLKTAITNVRVFDGWSLQPPQIVIIEKDGLIGGPTNNAKEASITIDGTGHVLLPGLIDSHCHPSNITHLHALARHGITTATVMACPSTRLCDSLRAHQGLTDVVFGSAPAAAAGSIHGNLFGLNSSTALSNASQADGWVNEQISHGAEFIKLIAETPGLSQEILSAAARASHARGKPVVAHAADSHSVRQALMANVSQVHHVPLDKALDEETADVFRENDIPSVPTLIMMLRTTQAIPKLNFTASRLSVSRLHDSGIAILVGTDANDQAGAPARPGFGSSIHDEMELLVEAGLSPIEVLRGATGLAAKVWRLHDRGMVEEGRRADLVLVEGDPTGDISASRNVRAVWVEGRRFE